MSQIDILKVSKVNYQSHSKISPAPLCPPGQRPYGPAAKEG